MYQATRCHIPETKFYIAVAVRTTRFSRGPLIFILFCFVVKNINYYLNFGSLQTPWPESESELYRPRNRRLSAKLMPTFAAIGYHVVSVTDPYCRIFEFLDRSCYFFFQIAPRLYSRSWADPELWIVINIYFVLMCILELFIRNSLQGTTFVIRKMHGCYSGRKVDITQYLISISHWLKPFLSSLYVPHFNSKSV
jgi:hypothetical protein